VVSATATADAGGYWILRADGTVSAFGDAAALGSPTLAPREEASAIFATAQNGGYWAATTDGSVFAFGNASYLNGLSTTHLNGTVVAGSGY
jgi:hypothetical protein